MNTILVWFLISSGGYNGSDVVYSPPLPDLEVCQFLQKNVESTMSYPKNHTRCVQIKMVVTK
jgi:hypothetical protein